MSISKREAGSSPTQLVPTATTTSRASVDKTAAAMPSDRGRRPIRIRKTQIASIHTVSPPPTRNTAFKTSSKSIGPPLLRQSLEQLEQRQHDGQRERADQEPG